MLVNRCSLTLSLLLSLTAVGVTRAEVEPISILLAPNQPVDFFFPNPLPPDPDHKDMFFVGTATSLGGFGVLHIVFDYFDPILGEVVVPPPMSLFEIPPGDPVPIDTGVITLPNCPQQVSLHLYLPIDSAPIELVGEFTHICLPVPEPSTLALGGIALGCLAVWRIRRRPAKSLPVQ